MTPAGRRITPAQRIAWIGLAASGLFVLLLGGYRTIAVFEAKLVLQIAAVTILGGWLLLGLARPRWRPNSPLVFPVALAALVYLASAALSQRPRLSLEPTIGGLGFALAFVFLARVLQEDWVRLRVGALLIVTTAFVAVGYHIEVIAEWIQWWQLLGFVSIPPLRPSWASLTLGAPNIVAAFLLLAGPLATVLLGQRPNGRGPSMVLGVLVVSAIFLTGARSAYLAAGFAVVVVAIVGLSRERLRVLVDRGRGLTTRRPLLLLVPITAVSAAALFIPALVHRFAQGGDSVRLALWRSAVEVFLTHPVTGSGPGTWAQVKVLANAPDTTNLIFSNAHNIYVQTAAELGAVGIVVLSWFVFQVARRLAKGLVADEHSRASTLAVIAALSAFSVHALFDTLVNMPTVALLVAGLAAWVDSGLARADTRHKNRARFDDVFQGPIPIVAALGGILISTTLLVRMDIAWFRFEAGRQAATNEDWAAARREFVAAYEADPDFTLYAVQLSSVEARLGEIDAARTLLADAIRDDPVAINQIALATTEARLGNLDTALATAASAMSAGPHEATVALNAGLIAEAAQRPDLALSYFADAVAWNPAIAGSEFWMASERLVPHAAVTDLAVSRSQPLDAVLILAYAGRTDEAEALLNAQPPSQSRDLYAALVVWKSGDRNTAVTMLTRMLESNPLDWTVAAWISRIARHGGDLNAAARYAKLALAVQGDSAPSVLLEHSVIPGPLDQDAGLPRSYPTGVYSRPGPPGLLSPLVVRIGLH